MLALDAKKWPEALDLEARSIAILEASSGKEAPDLFKPLAGMGQAKLGQGRPAEARSRSRSLRSRSSERTTSTR